MIEHKDFAKNISEIFNTQLGLRNKYDLTTRLVCDVLESMEVSILLYDSKIDALICKGAHVNINDNGVKDNDTELKSILSNISQYDFLQNKKTLDTLSETENLYKEFLASSSFLSKISANEFSLAKDKFINNSSLYKQVKETFLKEQYEINNDTITGKFFKKLLTLDTSFSNKFEIQNLNDFNDAQWLGPL